MDFFYISWLYIINIYVLSAHVYLCEKIKFHVLRLINLSEVPLTKNDTNIQTVNIKVVYLF
jgi:hypothetical protein